MKKITSSQNSQIKNLIKLQEKSRERKKQGVFVIEGLREISLAISSNYVFQTIFFTSELIREESITKIVRETVNIISIPTELYKKIAYRESTEGIIAIVEEKKHSLHNIIVKKKNPLFFVAESIEKPGNIGALLRTADAANIDAFLIANPKSDIYNPNLIRSSVGCVFTQQIGIGTSEEIIKFLEERNINLYAATLQNSNDYHFEDYTKPTALAVGTEATGLSKYFREKAFKNIKIPMSGKIDSMNVSVAGAILLYEAKRQRNFN